MTKIINNIVVERLDTLQKTLDVHISDSDREARENQDYRIKVISLEGQVEELRKNLKNLENKIQNRISETIEPLTEAIENKQVVEYKARPFWKFWGGGGKK